MYDSVTEDSSILRDDFEIENDKRENQDYNHHCITRPSLCIRHTVGSSSESTAVLLFDEGEKGMIKNNARK